MSSQPPRDDALAPFFVREKSGGVVGCLGWLVLPFPITIGLLTAAFMDRMETTGLIALGIALALSAIALGAVYWPSAHRRRRTRRRALRRFARRTALEAEHVTLDALSIPLETFPANSEIVPVGAMEL